MRVRSIWMGLLAGVVAWPAWAAVYDRDGAAPDSPAVRARAGLIDTEGAGIGARLAADVVLLRIHAAPAVEFSSRYGAILRQTEGGVLPAIEEGDGAFDLSPVTAEDLAPDLVRYRIAGTLATATGPGAVWNGATAVAEFSPGPNDGFEGNRWQYGRCRTALSRC